MSHVVILIGAPSGPPPTDALLARAAGVLPSAAAPHRLDDSAADISFAPGPGMDNVGWRERVVDALDGARLDVVVQLAATRRKLLLVADMDSTIIEQECIDELAESLGLGQQVAAITRRSMSGEIAFESALRERVAMLRGLDLAKAEQVVSDRISLTAGARTLAATMRAFDATTVIASGGFTIFTAHVAGLAGFDRHHANVLGVEDGRLSGRLREPVFDGASKRAVLVALREEFGLKPEQTLAVGDGANDLAMLEEAGLGVAFRARPAVAAVADARVEHGDLTALLYIQGISRKDFRTC